MLPFSKLTEAYKDSMGFAVNLEDPEESIFSGSFAWED